MSQLILYMLLTQDDLLLTWEFVSSSSQTLNSNLLVRVLGSDREDNLTNVNTGSQTVWLTPGTSHTLLQSIGTGTGQHLVDSQNVEWVDTNSQVERVTTRDLKNGLLSSLKSYSPLIKKLSRSKEDSDGGSDSVQNNSMRKAPRTEGGKDANSNDLFTSLADIAMDRKDEIGDDLSDDYQRTRAFETELSEYLGEPLLTNRNIKQYWIKDNHFDVLCYWRDKARDWPNLALFCCCLYATMAASVICERSFSFSSHILGKLRNKLSSTNLETLMLLKMNRVYGSPGSGDLDDEMFQLGRTSSKRSSEVDNIIPSQYQMDTLTELLIVHS